MKALIQKILVVCLMVTGVAGNAWGADARWTNGGTFTSSITLNESVTIPTGKTVTINGDLTIKPNSNNPVTLTVNGTLVVTGNIILKTGNNGNWLSRDYYGNLTNNGTVTANNITVGSGSTLTVAGVENMKIAGDLTNNGNVTIPNNLIVDGNVTNNGTITMNGGVLRIGTYKTGTDVLEDGTGDLALNDGSKLYYDNNGGKESNVEVRGDLFGDVEAYITSRNGGKGNLAVVGTYYDLVQDHNTYHPDWGMTYKKGNDDAFIIDFEHNKITDVSFEIKENANINLASQSYSILPKEAGSDFWSRFFAFFGLGTSISKEAEAKLDKIVETYKNINPENLNEILQEISEALPIELVFFRAQQDDGNVEFAWQTASELNNDYFTIEYSLNAIDFEELAIVAGSGTTTETVDYQYAELSANYSGTVYYRLKQTDYDGNFTYSDMIAVVFDKKQVIENPVNFVVYPNPASDYVTISGGEYQSVKFLSADGRVLKVEDAQNTHSVANMPNGVIYLVISTENGEVSKTLVKK